MLHCNQRKCFMIFKTFASVLLASFALANVSLVSADTLTGNTDTITAVLDREPNGQHTVVNGSFTFNTPANGNIVALSDLTAFDVSLTSQFAYNWGIDEPVQIFTGNLSTLQSFSFDISADILTMVDMVTTTVPVMLPDNSMSTNSFIQDTETLRFGPTPEGLGDYPDMAWFETAWGPADPTPALASGVPEPRYAMFTGLLLAGFGLLRWRTSKRIDSKL